MTVIGDVGLIESRRERQEQATPAVRGVSATNQCLGYGQGVIHLDAEVADRALELGMSE